MSNIRKPTDHRDELIASGIFIFFMAVTATVAGTLGYGSGEIDGRDGVRAGAIEAGVAEWKIDPKTGERRFEWLTPAE